ncbi:ribose 5-phosphate isomerase B [Blautia liquoris]|uniref:Ribose 5-phosphate isomerase B n=1 Tax=Blautia liquoris TaxID=2779518 RepID=A0A7M2RJ56_9FIRM|nr:ribose 5-phosphate isomerase B [Blautia liquoris]QOV20168.1 ribose 5-phosphate isomerase B [Blautia liquoris]
MIALGCDHGGYDLMQEVKNYLDEGKLEYKDFGCYGTESVDYPDYAKKVSQAIVSGECDKGILICGTGIGVSITANRIPGIRAALCTDCYCAEMTRLHNDANVLAMGGRVVGPGLAVKIVETFLNTAFSDEDRHKRRIQKIENC